MRPLSACFQEQKLNIYSKCKYVISFPVISLMMDSIFSKNIAIMYDKLIIFFVQTILCSDER